VPELPEVETIVRQLAPDIGNKRIKTIELLDPRFEDLETSAIDGARIVAVERLGKQIVISFARDSAILGAIAIHLRMSGRLIWIPEQKTKATSAPEFLRAASLKQEHCRARLQLEGGSLCFFDTRRFGTIKISDTRETFLPRGLDPFAKEFTAERFGELLSNSQQAVKVWLLRQDKLVGIGNIYACEILYAARVNPFLSVAKLSPKQIGLVHASTLSILNAAIENCGTTFSDFQDSHGELGSYQEFLKVYNRENEDCVGGCGEITRVSQQGRSTYYCSTCQK